MERYDAISVQHTPGMEFNPGIPRVADFQVLCHLGADLSNAVHIINRPPPRTTADATMRLSLALEKYNELTVLSMG